MKKILPLLLFTLLFSCNTRDMLVNVYQPIPKGKWAADKPVLIEANVENPFVFYNLYMNVRNTGDYAYSNLFVFLDIVAPSGNVQTDTVECILADHTGKWLGSSSGNIWDHHVLFKRQVRFAEKGTYSFKLRQGMREEELEGIADAGIAIEKLKAE